MDRSLALTFAICEGSGEMVEKNMSKQRATADELVWMITEELRSFKELSGNCEVAVIPDSRHGWLIVTSAKARKRAPTLERRILRVQTKLQAEYSLIKY